VLKRRPQPFSVYSLTAADTPRTVLKFNREKIFASMKRGAFKRIRPLCENLVAELPGPDIGGPSDVAQAAKHRCVCRSLCPTIEEQQARADVDGL